jgi:hypothetical protein
MRLSTPRRCQPLKTALLLRQYMYFCTGKASKLSVASKLSACARAAAEGTREFAGDARELEPSAASTCTRQHTLAYVSIR